MGSGREEAVTRFLNVDLDLRGTADDLRNFLKSIDTSVVVLNQTEQEASVELTKEAASLEETIINLTDLVGALPPEARNIWNRLEFRRANIGIQAGHEPRQTTYAIPAKAVELLARLSFEIIVTVYAPLPD